MKTTDLQKVLYVSCDEEHNGHRSINFKGLFSTIEKALSSIMDDINTNEYDVFGTKYEDITVENIERVIENGEVYIISAHDNGKNDIFPGLGHINRPSKYYYIDLTEIK